MNTADKWTNWLIFGGQMPGFVDNLPQIQKPITDSSMKQIKVIDRSDDSILIALEVNDECQHNGETEVTEVDLNDPYSEVVFGHTISTQTKVVEKCLKCGACYSEDSGKWEL